MERLLTADLALAYLRELSTDMLAGIVIGGGRRLAGPQALEAPARALLEAARGSEDLALRTGAGWVFAARSPAAALVVVFGPHTLAGLVHHDVCDVLRLLDPRAAPASADAAEPAPAEALAVLDEACARVRTAAPAYR